MPGRRALLLGGLAAGAAAAARAAEPLATGAGWAPDRPIRIIVPFTAGGSTDLVARMVAQAIAPALGQPVMIENRPGAGGNIAAEATVRASPDGHTLLMATVGLVAANKALYRRLPFDAEHDLAAISQVSFVPNLLVVRPDLPVTTVAELIALARARPGALNYGTAGAGTSQHLAGSLFAARAGVELTQIPYRGGAQAVTDLVAGKIDFIMSPLIEVLGQVQAGRLRPVGVTTLHRAALLPDVPTIAETLPGYEIALWNGLMAPAAVPAAAIARLAEVTQAAIRTPTLRAQLMEQGCEPVGSSPDAFASFIRAEIPRWTEIVRISGASAD